MSENLYDDLQQLATSEGPAAALDRLIETERGSKQYHKLFDALLMKQKFELGLPVTRPTTFEDVPEDKRRAFEDAYVETARQIGKLFLEQQNIPQAWIYFRTIQETEPVREALEQLGTQLTQHDQYDEILNIALYEGANPLMGIRMMLQSHGTCNTITSLDQLMHQLKPDDRARAAAVMVNHLYGELQGSLLYAVQQRIPTVERDASIRDLIAGRDWLFSEGNYHIDVSHLHSVVRFARSLSGDAPELQQAIQLAEYGTHLDPKLQYDGDPPFQEFYPSHVHFLKILAGDDAEAGFAYFRKQLEDEPDEQDKQLIAYVTVDLLMRTDRLGEAVDLAEQYLREIEDPNGFSFAELCRKAGRIETLEQISRERRDPLRFTAALVTAARPTATA